MKLIYSLMAVIILLFSCQNKNEKKIGKIEKINWLVGNWENKQADGKLVENWIKENDSIYSGESYFINSKDTVHFETIKLYQKGDDLIYSATVIGQNNDEPVDFKLTSESENVFSFENYAHEYPQKITYKRNRAESLTTTISGKQQGKTHSESYLMIKK